MKLSLYIISIFVFFTMAFAAINGYTPYCYISTGYAAELVDKIVAVVNDDIITQSELRESMLAFVADYHLRYGPEEAEVRLNEAKSDTLNRLVEEKLLFQEAKRREVKIVEADVEQRLENAKGKFESEEEFENALSKSGLTTEKLKSKYRDQLMIKALVNGIVMHNVDITPTQIAAYYYGHEEEFRQPEKVKFRIILLKFRPEQDKEIVRSFAGEIAKRAGSGEDFATLSRQYSEGPNAAGGGDMGFVSREDIAKEIREAIAPLIEGGVSAAIETSAGCNIVKLERKLPASTISLQEASSRVRERLFGREAELIFREFIDNLKKNAYIDIKE